MKITGPVARDNARLEYLIDVGPDELVGAGPDELRSPAVPWVVKIEHLPLTDAEAADWWASMAPPAEAPAHE